MGWVHIDQLCCPAGHHIRRDAFLITDGAVRCKFREPGTGHECGKIIYLLACASARAPEPEPTLYFVVEVSYEEISTLQRSRSSVLDALEALGAGFRAPEGS